MGMGSDSVSAFASRYPFELDAFQSQALEALAGGQSVLVAAPTGSGKTVVGEFAVWLALNEGRKAFYTTPLKALSNQKFGDFIALHKAENVGLLTGDNSINPKAPVVVMTTEVLRNMIYERSSLLEELGYVVLDEVHYLQDPYRGAVWEEVILHLPMDVKIVSLSATVSNAEEFAGWIETVRGATAAVIENQRPVDLEYHYILTEGRMLPMFTGEGPDRAPNQQIVGIESGWATPPGRSRARGKSRGGRGRFRPAARGDVVDLLAAREMLPAIYFIFSRKGCDAAAQQCLREGLSLTTGAERRRIREYTEARCSYLGDEDLNVLGYSDWVEALSAGVAAHHAGLIPVFKETVEELFQAGLVKVVFATETLSLGINMPARTVVIESMVKFTGERHELMTAGEFTQLVGRAGRRGIDSLGHAVVLERPDIPFRQIAGLASTALYPLVSSFQPSYNMATNLIRNYSREEAAHLLNSSFAQYHADKDVVVLERLIERNEAYLASYHEKMSCQRGDFSDYWRLVQQATRLERAASQWRHGALREQTRTALSLARPGQVFILPTGKRKGPVVVIGRDRGRRGEPRLIAVTTENRMIRLTSSDFPHPPKPVANLRFGPGKWVRGVDNETRRRLASALEALDLAPKALETPEETTPGSEIPHARALVRRHPCHTCPDRDRHSQWAERATRLERETEGMRKRIRARTETISGMFERVLETLEEFGYVEGFSLTAKGRVLVHIYNESDLLVSETLTSGWLEGLDPAEVAALVSTFVFESRGPFEAAGRLPTAAAGRAYARVTRHAERIKAREKKAGLELTRGTEAGFAESIYRWCRGASLEEVLGQDLTAGDFIRSCKQTIDLLRQLQEASDSGTLEAAVSSAIEGTNRGVVAYTGVM